MHDFFAENEKWHILSPIKHSYYYHQTLSLIEQSFNYQAPYHFDQDFSLLINDHQNPYPMKYSYLLINANNPQTVVAHIGIMPRHLLVYEKKILIGLIGGLCIHPQWRGKKIFSLFFEKTMSLFRIQHKEPMAFFGLWSEKTDYFKKFNFFHAFGFYPSVQNPPHISETSIETIFPSMPISKLLKTQREKIKNLYKKHHSKIFTLERTDDHWNDIFRSSIDVYFSELPKDIYSSSIYFFKNKGMDLKHIVHEHSCYDLFLDHENKSSHIQEYLNHLGSFYFPEFSQARSHPVLRSFITPMAHYQMMIRIEDYEAIHELIELASQKNIQCFSINRHQVQFRFQKKNHICSYQEILEYVFGPHPLQEFESFYKPLFIFGADSI